MPKTFAIICIGNVKSRQVTCTNILYMTNKSKFSQYYILSTFCIQLDAA